MLQSTTICHPSELPFDVLVRWRAALSAKPSWDNPLLTPEFASMVGEERPDTRIITAYDDQGNVGILGVHKSKNGYARPLGAPLSDHQGFITEAGFDADIEDVMHAEGLSVFKFTGLNDPDDRMKAATQNQQIAHLVDLRMGATPYFAAQQKKHSKHFKKMRQRARAATRDFGEITVQLDSRNADMFDLLMTWKRDQFRRTRKCDILASRWISSLLKRLWSEAGRVRAVLNMLYCGDKPVAAEIGLMCDGTYHSWIAAYNPAFARCSPGLLLLEGIMRQAETAGIDKIDLGVGHDHYKKYYSNDQVVLGEGKVLGNGFTAQKHKIIDTYGARFLANFPARLTASHDFMAACHPHWPERLRGFASRVAHIIP